MSSRNRCPKCRIIADVEIDGSRGDAVCTRCGYVLEENAIVSEVTFQEDERGTSSVVGQYVPESGVMPRKGGTRVSGMLREAREETLANGRRRIRELAQSLGLRSSYYVEAAQRYFQLAVQLNFIQGRRTDYVIAACLYTVCRREKTPHMLIDFSDVMQVNLYVLGAVFLKLSRLLNLSFPIIDPSLYIHRFAAKLEFGDKTHVVSLTALRIVQSMKRDWMQTGRRPSGICGAALFVAAKVHSFPRTVMDLVQVVHTCDLTIRKRLTEFAKTPSSQLTVAEFERLVEDWEKARLLRTEQSNEVEGEIVKCAHCSKEWPEYGKGLCKSCYVEWETLSGGCVEGSADPPAFQRSQLALKDSNSNSNNQLALVTTASTTTAASNSKNIFRMTAPSMTALQEAYSKISATINIPPNDDHLSDVDDAEIEQTVLGPDEIKIKTLIWEDINKEFLLEHAEKERLVAEGIILKRPSSRRKGKGASTVSAADLAAEAAAAAIKKKRASKINYAALDGLLNDRSSAASPSVSKIEDDVIDNETLLDVDDVLPALSSRSLEGVMSDVMTLDVENNITEVCALSTKRSASNANAETPVAKRVHFEKEATLINETLKADSDIDEKDLEESDEDLEDNEYMSIRGYDRTLLKSSENYDDEFDED